MITPFFNLMYADFSFPSVRSGLWIFLIIDKIISQNRKGETDKNQKIIDRFFSGKWHPKQDGSDDKTGVSENQIKWKMIHEGNNQ